MTTAVQSARVVAIIVTSVRPADGDAEYINNEGFTMAHSPSASRAVSRSSGPTTAKEAVMRFAAACCRACQWRDAEAIAARIENKTRSTQKSPVQNVGARDTGTSASYSISLGTGRSLGQQRRCTREPQENGDGTFTARDEWRHRLSSEREHIVAHREGFSRKARARRLSYSIDEVRAATPLSQMPLRPPV